MRDESDIYKAGKSFEYHPTSNQQFPTPPLSSHMQHNLQLQNQKSTEFSNGLIPSHEVDRQCIQTPLQYKAALIASQTSAAALKKAYKQPSNAKILKPSTANLGEHLTAPKNGTHGYLRGSLPATSNGSRIRITRKSNNLSNNSGMARDLSCRDSLERAKRLWGSRLGSKKNSVAAIGSGFATQGTVTASKKSNERSNRIRAPVHLT